MNFAHLHLMVNHIPLFATLFGGGLLAFGLMRDQAALRTAGLVFGLIAGLGGVAAMMTGERAEDIVERYTNVNEAAIHEHEEAAETTRWALAALGLLSLVGLLQSSENAKRRGRIEWATWVLFLITLGMVAWTANLGGPIRHPEVVDGAVSATFEADQRDLRVASG